MRDYDRYTSEQLHDKIPVVPADDMELKRDSREWRPRLGDSIYSFSQKGIPKRPGVHKRKNRITDMSGKNALLSSEFAYFATKPFRSQSRCKASFTKTKVIAPGSTPTICPRFSIGGGPIVRRLQRIARRECPNGMYSRTGRIWAHAQRVT